MFLRIALVEDDDQARDKCLSLLRQYSEEKKVTIVPKCFPDAMKFLSDYRPDYDIVFMDISMPGMNGLEAAKVMREYDKDVILIFVTDLAQYAIKGYEVDAYDYIVKPIVYQHLALKLDRYLQTRTANDVEKKIMIKIKDGQMAIHQRDIKYIEVRNHHIIIHTGSGNTYEAYGSLNEVEKILNKRIFSRCNNCYLVNLMYVTAVNGFIVSLGEQDKLEISHPKKKQFLDSLTSYLGEKI